MVELSIIIPVYNVESYLYRCIESIYSLNTNAFCGFEIILVDDGSTDNSGKLCDDLLKEHKEISVFHKKNGGLSDARNYGLTKAVGKYVCFMDSDDFLVGDLFYCYTEAKKKVIDFDILQYGFVPVFDGTEVHIGENIEKYVLLNNKEAYKDYLQGRQLKRAAWNKIYKKVLFDGIKYPVGKLAEDYGTTYKLLSKAQTILINETVIYGYYQRTDSIMGTRSLKLLKDEYFLGCEYYVFSKTNYAELEFLVNTEHLNLLIKSYSRLRLHRDYKKDKEEVDKLLLEIHDKICGMRIMNAKQKSLIMRYIFRVSPLISSYLIKWKDVKDWS